MRSGEGMTTTESSEFLGNYGYPHERTVNDVKVHLDGPRSGWLCRTAGVSVEPSWLPHFSPDDSVELTAEVSGCHSNATGATKQAVVSTPRQTHIEVSSSSSSCMERSASGATTSTYRTTQ